MSVLDTVRACLESARELEREGQFEAALSLYQRAEELDSSSWATRSCHLRALYQSGRIADAEGLLSDYLGSVQPAPRAALNDLGVIKAEQGEPTGALNCFVEALRSSSSASGSLVLGNLAYVLYTGGRKNECAKACDNALRLDPDESRAHYILSVVESTRYETRSRLASRIVREGAVVQVFRLLRWDGQSMTKHQARILSEEDPQLQLVEPVLLTRPGTHWGILATYRDELWCAFSRQCGGGTSDGNPVMPLPDEFHLVQRRRWVRVPATGAIARIEIRSFPSGVAPFELAELLELNLSAGGAAVRTVPELPRDTEVSLFLELDQQKEIEVAARVTRITRPQAAEAYSALAFVNLEEKKREEIAHFVHSVQLDRRRRGAQKQSESRSLPDEHS